MGRVTHQKSRLTVVRRRKAGHGKHDVDAQVAQRDNIIRALTPLQAAAAVFLGLPACCEAASLDADMTGPAAATTVRICGNAARPGPRARRPYSAPSRTGALRSDRMRRCSAGRWRDPQHHGSMMRQAPLGTRSGFW